jgi:hypothetical protein
MTAHEEHFTRSADGKPGIDQERSKPLPTELFPVVVSQRFSPRSEARANVRRMKCSIYLRFRTMDATIDRRAGVAGRPMSIALPLPAQPD